MTPGSRFRRAAVLVAGPATAGLSAAVSLVVPLLAPILLPLSAARLARVAGSARRGGGALFVSALAVPFAFLFGFLGGPSGPLIAPVAVLCGASLPALGLLAAARDGRRLDHVSIVVGAVTGVAGLSVLLGVAAATGQDASDLLGRHLDSTLPEMIAFYRSSGLNESSVNALEGVFQAVTWLVRYHLPGLVMLASFLYGIVVSYPAGRAAGVPGWQVSASKFSEYQTPLAAAILFVPAGLVAVIGGEPLRRSAVDLLLPLGALFFVRGLAIIRALLDRGGVGLVGRALAWALVIQFPMPVLVALGGLFDEFFGFRERFVNTARPGAGSGPLP